MRLAWLAVIGIFGVLVQEPHHLERFPAPALLSAGRVVESAPTTLITETRDVGTQGRGGLAIQRTRLDLAEAEGFIYFMEAEEELPLRAGLSKLRPGDWIETAAMPGREFSQWITHGSDSSFAQEPQRGFEPLTRPQATQTYIGVSGWLYVWVVAESRQEP